MAGIRVQLVVGHRDALSLKILALSSDSRSKAHGGVDGVSGHDIWCDERNVQMEKNKFEIGEPAMNVNDLRINGVR